jgi:hypothetical protein
MHFKRATGNPTMRSPAEEKTQDRQRSIPNVAVKMVDRKRGENEASRRLHEKSGKWLQGWIQLKRTADILCCPRQICYSKFAHFAVVKSRPDNSDAL